MPYANTTGFTKPSEAVEYAKINWVVLLFGAKLMLSALALCFVNHARHKIMGQTLLNPSGNGSVYDIPILRVSRLVFTGVAFSAFFIISIIMPDQLEQYLLQQR